MQQETWIMAEKRIKREGHRYGGALPRNKHYLSILTTYFDGKRTHVEGYTLQSMEQEVLIKSALMSISGLYPIMGHVNVEVI